MGYLMIDNRASGGELHEYDTTGCRHCQRVLDIKKWKESLGHWWCSKCDGPVCSSCVAVVGQDGNFVCDPWQAKAERELKAVNI